MSPKTKVGYAFSEYVYTERTRNTSHGSYGKPIETSMRGFLFPFFILLGSLFLLGRLFYLQIISGDTNRALSDSNRTRTTIIHAPRGIIFDRNQVPLVFNTPGFRTTQNNKTQFIDQQSALSLLAKGQKLEIDSLRNYPYKNAFAHVVGYVGQIGQEELSNPAFSNYLPNDVIGKMGLEQSYESTLKGVDGKELIEVDATGEKVRTLGSTDPIPGQNITTTLDEKLQFAVYEAMKDVKKGAAIVSKPDGEILAIVSKPDFDPNLFTMGKDYVASASGYQHVDQVLLDGNGQPLLDRAIGGVYPPGSTFKLLTAIAGLESGAINDTYTVDDTGILRIGSFSFANWYYTEDGKTEGTVDIVKAIKRSNDIFFYKVASLVGVDTLAKYAEKFGVGNTLGIDMEGEKKGLMPTKEWKESVIGDKWYLGDDYHLGIGQGYLLVTPLQVNAWTQAIANQGILYQPHLLKTSSPKILGSSLMSQHTFDLVHQGMIEACQPGGVAWPLFNFPVTIACKTGTAEQGGPTDNPHAWITLFAPAYHPQIVVTVLSEDSGEGSNVAGPIAKQILEAYFGD